MKLIRKTRDVKPDELGHDNTLMNDPTLGAYMIKDADFRARRAGTPINVYPVTKEVTSKGTVPEYSAVLMEEDYRNVVTVTPSSGNN